jgi:tetratricopeptide (TPR) repeat protein
MRLVSFLRATWVGARVLYGVFGRCGGSIRPERLLSLGAFARPGRSELGDQIRSMPRVRSWPGNCRCAYGQAMGKNAVRPLRRLLAGVATTMLCGCGQATPGIVRFGERQSLPGRHDFDSPVKMVATLPDPPTVLPASYPAEPLPAIEAPNPSTVRPNAAAREDTPAPLLSIPADVQPARTLETANINSAYAVAPKRTANPDDQLAPLSGPSNLTPELIAAARQADVHVARGFRLAERGALFTARAELRQALLLSAAALDEQRNTNAQSRALNNGLRALSEAEDFVAIVRSAGRTARAVETISQSHHTPVLHGEAADELDASRAIERYLSYAQEQLAAAAGDLQPAASALYALGKLESAAATDIGSLESARAAVYLQAALVVNPRHALAANELGVLFARHGRLAEAKAALAHTLRLASLPAAWRNLSIVHHGLGEIELAGQAEQEWQRAAANQTHSGAATQGTPAVAWVDPATFAQSRQSSMDMPAADKTNQPAATAPVAAVDTSEKENAKDPSSWFSWFGRSR